jgi:hypothetical protein
MDPIGETSAEVLINHIVELWSSGPCGRREVFPLGGTAWGDDKNLSHTFVKWLAILYCTGVPALNK